jgi:hypothetical protein
MIYLLKIHMIIIVSFFIFFYFYFLFFFVVDSLILGWWSYLEAELFIVCCALRACALLVPFGENRLLLLFPPQLYICSFFLGAFFWDNYQVRKGKHIKALLIRHILSSLLLNITINLLIKLNPL